jgi:hypothetical protein
MFNEDETQVACDNGQADRYLNLGGATARATGPGLMRKGEARRAALAVVLESTRFNGTTTDDIRAACDAIDAFTEGN